mmetsp:Transcript_32219/g.28547  ORF Transcript_32219/g.28547 Transcript_32219/m.28547 type:complete len:146 (-) Transcript_32219:285-722(-)
MSSTDQILSLPNTTETPLLLPAHPEISLSGSDQRRSQRSPISGTSVGRGIFLICSISSNSGEIPPWTQKIFSSIIAATGRQLKQVMNLFQSFMLYRLFTSQKKPLILFIEAHSWLPLKRKKCSGYLILLANNNQITSKDCLPIST